MFGFFKNKQLEQRIEELESQIKNETLSLSDIAPGTELWDIFTGGPSSAGVSVTPNTSMKVSAVFACVRLIANSIASLPIPIFKAGSDKRERVQPTITKLLNKEACPAFTAFTFWQYIVMSVLLRGDGLAWIYRGSKYNPTPLELRPLKRDHVTIKSKDGRLRYEFYDENQDLIVLDQDDVLHFTGFGFDGVSSMSVISWAAIQSIGTAIAAEEYSGEFFANGARPDIVLEQPEGAKKLTTEQAELIQKTWMKKYSGKAKRHLPAVMVGGLKANPITMNAHDSQLIETRKFQVIDIARAFGVPPHMIGEVEKTSSWGTGVEQQTIGFIKFSLTGYYMPWEQELNRKLFRSGRAEAEFNLEGLLRGDSKTRADFYKSALGGSSGPAWMTQNEIRRLENLEPIDDPEADKLTTWTKGNDNESTDEESETDDDSGVVQPPEPE